MIGLAFFVAIALAFVGLLIWVFSHQPRPFKPACSGELFELLETYQLGLPSRQVAERIFAKEDWNFIREKGSKALRKRFLKERRSVALSWIQATKRHVSKILVLYRLAVRASHQARLQSEMQVVLNYVVFWLTCQALSGVVWLLGPFRAMRGVGLTLNVAERLIGRTADFLADLEPSRLQDLLRTWEQTPA